MTSLEALIAEARARPLTGWDVSYNGRIRSDGPDWSFAGLVAAAGRASPDLLDMGTGGGEWLSRLACRPPRTVTTEGWPPNVDIARARLAPLGIPVVPVDGAPDNADQPSDEPGGGLPFPDDAFTLVSNRHEAYLPAEVFRVLAPGGRFLTQQVATPAANDLYRLVGLAPPSPRSRAWTLALASEQLTEAGFDVDDGATGNELLTFADVGALVWYLLNLPWTMPEFDVEHALPALRRLHAANAAGELLRARLPLFWLTARKPAGDTGSGPGRPAGGTD